jgi:hypothetical protein
MLGISVASAKELADLGSRPRNHLSPLGLRYSSLISTAIHHSCRLPLSIWERSARLTATGAGRLPP